MTDEMVAWLREQVDEDERAVQAATRGPWFWADPSRAGFPQGGGSLLADESPTAWQACAHYCTWSGEENLHRGISGQPGHEHRMVTEVVGSWGHDEWGITVSEHDAVHIARHDPARVLAEVAAKRRIIDLHHSLGPSAGTEDEVVCDACGPEEDISFRVETYGGRWPCTTLRLLASVYAGRPGWRSEWAPDEEENR